MSAAPPDRLERVVGTVLRWGAISSSVLLAAGLVLGLVHADFTIAARLMQIGLIVLISTPVARVVASVAGYAAERDWLFLGLTSAVLLVLLGSLLVAMG